MKKLHMKNRIFYTILSATFITFASSCESLLDVQPRQSIDAETALTNVDAISAATNAVYARLRDVSLYGRDLIAIPEVLADNAINTGAGNRLIRESNNEVGYHLTNWRYSYYAINQINLNLEALDKVDIEEGVKNNLKAENLFLRALLYHNLLKVYAYDPTAIIAAADNGGVPLMTIGVISTDNIPFSARNTVSEGYDFIYEDLKNAAKWIDKSKKNSFFGSYGAIAALWSRVALYNGDYKTAVEQADIAMASGVAGLTTKDTFVAGWRTEKNPESFFEVAFSTTDNLGSNESLRATFMTRTTVTATATASFGNVVLSNDLFNAYTASDLRKSLVMKGLGANVSRNEMTKFASKNGVPNLDNVPVIRYAEVVLNKAEALARDEKYALANVELNKIRVRSNLPVVNLVGEVLIKEILLQRRLELAFEGHRFFDLKRLGMDVVKEDGSVEFQDFRILARIPIREVEINKNLKQNRGY